MPLLGACLFLGAWLIKRCCISVQVSELIIPTAESACQSFFLKMNLEAKNPVLFVGPTGTGKSAVILNYLSSLPRDKFICSVVNFSAWTSANQTQEILMSKLDRYFTLSCQTWLFTAFYWKCIMILQQCVNTI